MREDVVTTKVYQFDELSDSAKEEARDWWRESENEFFGEGDCLLEAAETAAEFLGIEFDTRSVKLMGGGTRQKSLIYWSGFNCQGDGASFKGRYGFKENGAALLKAEFGNDAELYRIADELTALQAKNGNSLTAKIDQGGNYAHSYSMSLDYAQREDDGDVSDGAEDELIQLMRDFADWIYDGLRTDYEWRMEDEQVDDNIRANEYEFTENGKRY